MSEKMGMLGKLAASRLLVLLSDQQEPANYRRAAIDHQIRPSSGRSLSGKEVM